MYDQEILLQPGLNLDPQGHPPRGTPTPTSPFLPLASPSPPLMQLYFSIRPPFLPHHPPAINITILATLFDIPDLHLYPRCHVDLFSWSCPPSQEQKDSPPFSMIQPFFNNR
eukprot:TRINITY_DN5840_c0_g2_i2.p1 TRINITY_DN5840_c0_g2~~TRINITY_DN5840_c0_g2_i2.p1  ORF type:complete len:112 (-),score=28.32 TRINITY_DN5840_c0_g2_i2:930-1265(-)